MSIKNICRLSTSKLNKSVRLKKEKNFNMNFVGVNYTNNYKNLNKYGRIK